jgi:hypothetical protein
VLYRTISSLWTSRIIRRAQDGAVQTVAQHLEPASTCPQRGTHQGLAPGADLPRNALGFRTIADSEKYVVASRGQWKRPPCRRWGSIEGRRMTTVRMTIVAFRCAGSLTLACATPTRLPGRNSLHLCRPPLTGPLTGDFSPGPCWLCGIQNKRATKEMWRRALSKLPEVQGARVEFLLFEPSTPSTRGQPEILKPYRVSQLSCIVEASTCLHDAGKYLCAACSCVLLLVPVTRTNWDVL